MLPETILRDSWPRLQGNQISRKAAFKSTPRTLLFVSAFHPSPRSPAFNKAGRQLFSRHFCSSPYLFNGRENI